MSALFASVLACTFTLSSTYTLIPTSGYQEDWKFTTTPPDTSTSTESWWYNPASGYLKDLGQTGTSPQDGKVWGWYNRDSDDPSNTISRDFKCPEYSTVTLTFNVYFCISGTAGSQTTLWYRRSGLLNPVVVQYNKNGGGGIPGYGGWSSRGTGLCGRTIKKATVSDSFVSLPGTTGGFTVAITKKLENGGLNNNNQIVAFNNFNIQCSQIPTPRPTKSPTPPTKSPTNPLTRQPTASPTKRPTPRPTPKPTKPPTNPRPTPSPTTKSPTPRPTASPTNSPTKSPTRKPTDDPTKKPTGKPTDRPSYAPTSQRAAGRVFTDAFGFTKNSECVSEDLSSWIRCNLVMFIIIVTCAVVFCCYWICGVVWYKRRQSHRYDKMPSALAGHDANQVQMSTGGGHVTSDKWKSAWEKEQEEN